MLPAPEDSAGGFIPGAPPEDIPPPDIAPADPGIPSSPLSAGADIVGGGVASPEAAA